ncbi:hypothetical protein N8I77_006308 [Diaporthe amygdali]|uniref:Inhibitor of growth protein N-terminal histone-binding domain-containing protein n=1 Tax=Phomopsis amygdali TaxID=1214568 RepID=A0AAD9W6G6_PHOAM|nr:hypothetical protein N8I77_006308 [Diaporthe amygdali]
MKTAKVVSGESSSSNRRSQPVRQTRTNPPRSNAGLNRLAARDSLSSANAAEQPIDIFPGVTHFADAITALPKELVRHFTLLKEVDAKVFAPQEQLFQFVQDALDSPPPGPARSLNDVTSSAAPASAPMSAANSSSGIAPHGNVPPEFSANGSTASSVFDDSNLARRHLFRSTAVKIQEMLNSLEEKNHVISTANDALRKQLNRIDDIWPHLSDEFSEEAKWGSDSHWAYPENRAARALNSQAERTRREGAAHLSAAAQFVAEEAAARSESRKQAVAAKKSAKNHTHDSEHDDHDNKGKPETTKKAQSNTKRKTAAGAANAESPANVGLGITGQTPASNTPAPKRRKVEKPPPNGGTPTERSMAAVLQNGKNSKTKASESPRATPAPEQPAPKKQRKALPNSTGQAKKRQVAGPAQPPSVTSSPVIGTFPDASKPPRASPVPPANPRPASSRARQNSTASIADKRPPSVASNKANGNVPAPIEIPPPSNGSRGVNNDNVKTQMEPPSAGPKIEPVRQQSERVPTPKSAVAASGPKEGSAKPAEEVEARKELTPASAPPAVQQVTTTKSGRASKPSTPAIGSFPDNPPTNSNNNNNNNPRSRPSRNSEAPAIPKRSHKKGASAAHAAAVQKALVQPTADEDHTVPTDENDVYDPDEPTYCYCERVSFGQMVGCDGEHCKREWFHLGCVGLKVAPGKSGKSFVSSVLRCW